MLSREALEDGSLRLTSATSTLVVARVQVGVVRVVITGDDVGAFGAAPFRELEAERARFDRPLSLFVDLGRVTGAAPVVSDAWTAWLRTHRRDLVRVEVLVGSRLIGLTVAIAKHYSDSGALITVHEDRARFEAALAAAAPEWRAPLRAPAPVAIERRETPSGARLSGGGCSFEYSAPRRGAVLVRIVGHDAGQLGAAPLDELDAWIVREGGPVEVFCDASGAVATAAVSELWIAWLRARRARIARLHLRATSKLLGLTVAIANERAGTRDLGRVHADAASFEAALAG